MLFRSGCHPNHSLCHCRCLGNNHHATESSACKQKQHDIKYRRPEHLFPVQICCALLRCRRFVTCRDIILGTLLQKLCAYKNNNQKNRSNRFERNRSILAIYNNRNNRRQNHGTHSIYSSRNAAYQTTFIRKIFHTRRDGCPIGHSKSQSGYQTIADD